MPILVLESATSVAGVALMDHEKVIAEEWVNYKKTHSEILMPLIDRALKAGGKSKTDLDAIVTTVGPGSFTGLRIGLATAKGLAMAAQIPLVGVGTLETMAHSISYSPALVCPMLDARKNEVYSAIYDVSGYYPQPLTEVFACSCLEALDRLLDLIISEHRPGAIILGDGYFTYAEQIKLKLGDWLWNAPTHHLMPRASCAGSLAIPRIKRREFNNVFTLKPTYVRLSEAQVRLGLGEI